MFWASLIPRLSCVSLGMRLVLSMKLDIWQDAEAIECNNCTLHFVQRWLSCVHFWLQTRVAILLELILK